jgi:hypothetical protein
MNVIPVFGKARRVSQGSQISCSIASGDYTLTNDINDLLAPPIRRTSPNNKELKVMIQTNSRINVSMAKTPQMTTTGLKNKRRRQNLSVNEKTFENFLRITSYNYKLKSTKALPTCSMCTNKHC